MILDEQLKHGWTHLLSFMGMELFSGKSKASSACTYEQSDLALHTLRRQRNHNQCHLIN